MKKKKNKKKTHYNLDKKINRKVNIIIIFIILVFSCIFFRISYLNIFRSSYYKMLLTKNITTYVYGESTPRGRIYDRNHKLLVDNTSVKSIYYKKNNDITIKEEITLAYEVSNNLLLDYDNLSNRNLKEFYLLLYPDMGNKKITSKEYNDLENRKLNSDDIYELKIDRLTDDDLKVLEDKDKKAAYLYYLMNNGYYYDEKDIKIKDVTEQEYAYILENTDKLKGFFTKLEWERVYLYNNTLRDILGNVSSTSSGIPKEEASYYLEKGYLLTDRVGISGIEKEYEDILKGEKAKYKVLDDGTLELISEGKKGTDIVLSIDIDLQLELEGMLDKEIIKTKKEANTRFYSGSYIVIQNPNTGEIISMVGRSINKNKIYDNSLGNILTNVTPGSVVKGASIIVGYNTKVIDIGTIMEDKCIKLYNLPLKCSWKTLGTINDIEALARSSNVYQYKIAMMVGGFTYKYGKELKIDEKAFDTYRNVFYQFGLGVSTGIDYPMEETGYKGTSTAGDLLINFSIGQYDTYTPIQLSQYISTIANGGSRIKPHFLKQVLDENKEKIYEVSPVVLNKVETSDKYMKRVQEGFKKVMSTGTGRFGYMGSAKKPAGKTGTSESFIDVDGDGVIDYETISNNFVGYAPYDNPVMSIVVSSPHVQDPNLGTYKSDVNLRVSKKASDIFFKYYDYDGNKK